MTAQSSAGGERSESTVEGNELILRDLLAIDRPILANERTILAYFRTMLALLVSAPLLFGFGVRRYRRVSRNLRCIRR
jgi:uncharacterized membrane protein YidH (DUF202 family)